jgi:hypothetical protein
MEITVIALSILLGLAIIGLGAIVVVQTIVHSRDRRDLQRLIKAKSLIEYSQVLPEEEEEEEEPVMVDIENVGAYLGDKGEN